MLGCLKEYFKKNFLSLVLSSGTTWYGVELLIMTDSFERFSLYNKIQPYLSSIQIGIILFIVGLLKLIAILLNNFKLKRLSLTLIIFMWFFIAISALLSEPRNMITTYAFTFALFALGLSFRNEECP